MEPNNANFFDDKIFEMIFVLTNYCRKLDAGIPVLTFEATIISLFFKKNKKNGIAIWLSLLVLIYI